jgi:hypothetical protein
MVSHQDPTLLGRIAVWDVRRHVVNVLWYNGRQIYAINCDIYSCQCLHAFNILVLLTMWDDPHEFTTMSPAPYWPARNDFISNLNGKTSCSH